MTMGSRNIQLVELTGDVDGLTIGGKAAGLVPLAQAGLPVPPAVVVPAEASDADLEHLAASVAERFTQANHVGLDSVLGADVFLPLHEQVFVILDLILRPFSPYGELVLHLEHPLLQREFFDPQIAVPIAETPRAATPVIQIDVVT